MGEAWRIGIDSGGTFTDICLVNDDSGQCFIWKAPSTPDDPSRAISQVLGDALVNVKAQSRQVAFLAHGTTVGTNALLQRRGVRTGLITTEGFRDILEIGRQKRPALYDLQADKPRTLVERALRIGVPERCRHDGTIEKALDEEAVRDAARRFANAGVQAVAICFLYGFLNSKHERRAAQIVAEELPEAFICSSHEVAPEFREFERMSTTVVNAYLGPIMRDYIERLARRLTDLSIATRPLLTQSNGGVTSLETAARLPVRTILSGPSTGVVAAQVTGRAAGISDIITLDMGGTSTDVALLVGGRCGLAADTHVEGYPIKAPMLDIHAVGAGGGSIAYVDSGGLLKVGPTSAGASPGPVCYDRGGTQPTVTDAHVLMRTLNPDYLLGGRMAVHRGLAASAIGRLAEQLRMEPLETAAGIVAVVTANMAKAIRVISIQRGHDARNYTLMAFGGAGPLHAAWLARELGMRRVLIPVAPGAQCALGLLMTDLRTDFSLTQVQRLSSEVLPRLEAIFSRLVGQALDWFDRERIAGSARRVRRTIDMRYVGQNYELSVALPDGPLGHAAIGQLAEGMAAAHRQRYGFAEPDNSVELVTYRVEATGIVPKFEMRAAESAGPDASGAIVGVREVWFPELRSFVSCPVYARAKLAVGNRFAGPAIIEQDDATSVVLPGMNAWVEPHLNLVLEDA